MQQEGSVDGSMSMHLPLPEGCWACPAGCYCQALTVKGQALMSESDLCGRGYSGCP
jgi:hypothetical protein